MERDVTREGTADDLRQALRASEARFRNTIEKNADGILIVGRDGAIRFANPAAEVLLGRRGGQLVGHVFGIPVIPGETTEIDLLHGGAPAGVAEMRVVEIDWEGRPAYLASLRDVTERKRSAEAARFLAEAGTVLAGSLDLTTTPARVARLCVSHLADGCLIDLVEPDGSIRRAAAANAEARRDERARTLLGRFSLDGRSTATLARVLTGGRPEVYPELPEGALAGLAPNPEAARTLRDFGCRSAVLLPLQARGRTLGVVTLLRGPSRGDYGFADLELAEDLVRRAALAIDNARLYEEAQEAVRRRDEFLAMLAHELRNPLAPVRNAMELMRLKCPDDGELRWARTMVERQVTHMTRLVDDLLDVSRITRGKIALRKEPVRLAEVVAQATETSRPLIEARRHRLEVALPPDVGTVEGDFTRLVQVLSNLLNNAAKYTDPGGLIRLSVELTASGVGLRPDEAVIRVADNGLGIPPAMLPHIFDLFTQVDATLERSQGGLGIGLTLVRSLVEMHGGSVQAFSEGRGKGSEFVVRLPLLGTGAAPVGGGQAPSGLRSPHFSLNVLVVDDNVDAAESLALLLKTLGHEATTAYDGPQAIEAARAVSPDLVICD
ncbi:MAG TPA: ATP-binding protein, partial [Gemmataceae bacterium]|nr:ATP-binding protein [Gemmataceae bacterium]